MVVDIFSSNHFVSIFLVLENASVKKKITVVKFCGRCDGKKTHPSVRFNKEISLLV